MEELLKTIFGEYGTIIIAVTFTVITPICVAVYHKYYSLDKEQSMLSNKIENLSDDLIQTRDVFNHELHDLKIYLLEQLKLKDEITNTKISNLTAHTDMLKSKIESLEVKIDQNHKEMTAQLKEQQDSMISTLREILLKR